MRVIGKINRPAVCGKNTGIYNNKQVVGITWYIRRLNCFKNVWEKRFIFYVNKA